MTRKITEFIICLLACLWMATAVQAQVYTQRITGSTANRFSMLGNPDAAVTELPTVDTAPLLAEDEQRTQKGLPLRVGVSLPVTLDVMRLASPVDRGNVRVYTYRITAPGALAVSVLFSQLQLAEGAQVLMYDANRTTVFGPISPLQNGNDFWTDFITGSSVIIEVQEPLRAAGQSLVQVASVVHSYRNVTGSPKSFGTVGGSGSCEVNMVCQPAYQTEGDGVALILASYGGYTYACTGSAINSTKQDFRSYFLTAFHCVDFSGDGTISSGESAVYDNAQFRFNWQSPTCTPSQEDLVYVTMTGATLKAARKQSDFSLFELKAQLPQSENITYLGWNRSSDNATSVVAIHHPVGDVKKISFGGGTVVSGYGTTGTDHLTAFWTTGATEGGSSGSPLFDQNRRVIGQLHGGPSFCGAPTGSLKDYYGRFYTSWDAGGSLGTQLKDYLDPANSGALTVDEVKAAISGAASFTGSASFGLNVGTGTSVSWSVSNGVSAVTTASGSGAVATLVAANGANNTSVTVVFTVNAGQPYAIQFTRTIAVTASAVVPQPFAFLPAQYSCSTGAITFQTTAGDGASIEYRAVGVTDWTTNPNQFIDAPVRADGQALTLMARQSGQVITTSFDFRSYCTSVTPPAGPTALTITSFNCASTNGALSSVNFVVGYSDGSTTPALPDLFINGVTITGQLGQSYTYTFDGNQSTLPIQDQATRSTYFVWNFRDACSGPVPPPTSPATLTITSFTCNTTNSVLSSVDFVVGYSDGTFTPALPNLFINGVTITGQLGQRYTFPFDGNQNTLPIQDQTTRSTYFVWNFRQACTQPVSTRMVAESAVSLQINVLGNPVRDFIDVEISGAEGGPLTLMLTDILGRNLGQQRIEQAGALERIRFTVAPQFVG